MHGGGRARQQIADYQRALALDPDGIPGSATRTRVQNIMQMSLAWPEPLTVTGGLPKPASALQAATDLHAYVLTFKGTHADRIKAYQAAMSVAADGVIGPKTKAAYTALTKKAW